MFGTLRTPRRFTLATLTAFLLVQPAMACAALCLLERHSTGGHSLTMDRDPTLTGSDCHHSKTGAVQPAPLPTISPMEPAQAMIIAVALPWTKPVWAFPTPPHHISHPVEPPPPRLA
jgi:hypothetical protein